MGQNQRRALWWRIKPYLSEGGRPDAVDIELELEEDPYGGPVPGGRMSDKELAKLRDEARDNGYRDGRSGMYDEWSLSTGSRPPYLMTLEAKREEALAEERVRSLRDLQRLEERIAVTTQDLKKCEEQYRRTEHEIERLAEQEQEIQELLSGNRPKAGANQDSPPGGHPDGTRREGAAPGGATVPDHPGYRWAEPTRGLKRRLLAGVARVAVMALFAAVELPIQYATFLYFGESPMMTWAFVIGTAGAMLVAPHLAGGWTKRMRMEGWRSPLLPGTLVVLLGWLAGVWLLAFLRTAVLFVPTVDSVTLEPVRSTIDALDLGRAPVTVLFAALLTLSGVVTFTYGYLGENPYAARLADIQRERRKLEKVLAALEGRRHRDDYLVSLAETRKQRHAERWQAWIAARGKPYEVCAAVYLQAVADAMRNPAFTESASQWLRDHAAQKQPAG
ncbi:hypothetical protein GCM10022226_65400 [Sphaerisporangium flaviroseum]|uniref:Uncharacterized protein n=1 Tax=Sphaerisporangium flaviroseum TaxID=509199 RepID=A0ABP7J4R1_9ACTN